VPKPVYRVLDQPYRELHEHPSDGKRSSVGILEWDRGVICSCMILRTGSSRDTDYWDTLARCPRRDTSVCLTRACRINELQVSYKRKNELFKLLKTSLRSIFGDCSSLRRKTFSPAQVS
jgi:hypothetical protein